MKITKQQLALHKFASQSELRPALMGVHTDGVTAVATDTFRLVEMRNTASDAAAESPLTLLDLKAVKLGKLDSADVTGDGSGDRVSLQVGDVAYQLPIEDASEYPKYQEFFDNAEKRDGASIKVNGKWLAEILAEMAKLNDLNAVTLKVSTDPCKPLIIRAAGSGHEARALLMPLNR
jgi:hypothetical protein